MSTARPVQAAERLPFPDALRGVALLGILPANLPWVALPLLYAMDPAPLTGGTLEALGHYATRLFFDYKFITLFSLLFGLGLGIQFQRVRERGGAWGWFAGRRLAILFVFGLLHAFLLFWGDILGLYALVGLLTMAAVALKPRVLVILGSACITLPFLLLILLLPLGFGLDWLIWQLPPEARETEMLAYTPGLATGTWAEFLEGLGTLNPAFEEELHREGSWLFLACLRLGVWAVNLVALMGSYGWRVAGLFLLGMAAVADGRMLRPDHHPEFFRRLVGYGLLVGGPLHGLLLLTLLFGGESVGMLMVGECLLYLGSLGLAAAYAGLVGLVVARAPGWLHAPFRAVGRTALSGYLLQSVVMNVLFAGWGLALFGQLDRAALWGVVLATWTAQLVLATLWLQLFRQGPMEALWRRLTYGRSGAKAVRQAA